MLIKDIKKGLFAIIVILFGLFSGTNILENENDIWEMADYNNFKPSYGDYFVVDLENGMGYLVNDAEKNFTFFPLLTGQKRNVCYIGSCYYAATPEKIWTAEEENIQSDRITFDESGKFLRLFDGEKSTHYGIHGHAYFETMIEKDNKFQSMGCILVSDDALNVIEESFVANVDKLKVITTKEVDISFLFKLFI